MPNWTKLCEAELRNDPNVRCLALIDRIEDWLDLEPGDATVRSIEAVPDEATGREYESMMSIVGLKLQRDLSIPTEQTRLFSRLQDLAARNQSGALSSEERRLWARFQTLFLIRQKLRERFPVLENVKLSLTDDVDKRAELLALQQRQSEAQRCSVPGLVSVEWMETLDSVLSDYRRLIASVALGTPLYTDIAFYAGQTAYALGRGWSLLGRGERAGARYAEASELFKQASLPADATHAAEKARELGYIVKSDFDGASAEDLRSLVAGLEDPFKRGQAYARLSRLAGESNAVFDAVDYADKAANYFAEAGFPDPEGHDIDETFDAWIDTACKINMLRTQDKPLVLLEGMALTYITLLRARYAARVGTDPTKAEETQTAINVLSSAIKEAIRKIGAVQTDVTARLADYVPILTAVGANETDVQSEDVLQCFKRLVEQLDDIQLKGNEAKAAHDMHALKILKRRTEECIVEARNLGVLPAIGQAYYMDAYVRLCEGDTSGCIRSAKAGEAALLAGAPAVTETLAAHPEFSWLLMLRKLQGNALIIANDTKDMLDLAEETVRAIEAQRYHVSDPYQQGAFLADRTIFYEMLISSAYKLGRWDDVLSSMELVKARAALVNRLSPTPILGWADINARLAAANEALAKAKKGSDVWRAANEQRRLLLSLQAIERQQAAGVAGSLPDLSINAVQESLAPDETVVSWVWLDRHVLITLAVDRTQVHCQPIVLSKEERQDLDDYVAIISNNPLSIQEDLGDRISRLAAAVLPSETLRFIAGARRLILSPHRSLHVLPFHAAILNGRFLIEQAAVRYVPNLGSLIIPWRRPSAQDAGLLSIGIDVFQDSKKYNSLNNAEAEARSLTELWSARGLPARLMTGRDATVAAFLGLGEKLLNYRCLHLATHSMSVFGPEVANDPFATQLILQDGALDAQMISQLRIGAEVVVLSACESGQQALSGRGLNELPGDDIFGLPAAFFDAGVCGVIGALWPVLDAVAPLIMRPLHEGIAEGTPPELALQKAFIDYLRDPFTNKDVRCWAPMFLMSVGRIT